jgi:hypothetical protein
MVDSCGLDSPFWIYASDRIGSDRSLLTVTLPVTTEARVHRYGTEDLHHSTATRKRHGCTFKIPKVRGFSRLPKCPGSGLVNLQAERTHVKNGHSISPYPSSFAVPCAASRSSRQSPLYGNRRWYASRKPPTKKETRNQSINQSAYCQAVHLRRHCISRQGISCCR